MRIELKLHQVTTISSLLLWSVQLRCCVWGCRGAASCFGECPHSTHYISACNALGFLYLQTSHSYHLCKGAVAIAASCCLSCSG